MVLREAWPLNLSAESAVKPSFTSTEPADETVDSAYQSRDRHGPDLGRWVDADRGTHCFRYLGDFQARLCGLRRQADRTGSVHGPDVRVLRHTWFCRGRYFLRRAAAHGRTPPV